jgi:Uma2 family endonuclease
MTTPTLLALTETPTRLVTAAEFEHTPSINARTELVKGVIISYPFNDFAHGALAATICMWLGQFVFAQRLGDVLATGTGFILSHNPDTVRAPDAAFVTAERVAQAKRLEGFFDGAPDLAVEVVSPDDKAEEIDAKVLEYLEAGCRLVWVVQPRTKTITEYRSLDQVRVLTQRDTLDGADVVPGFTVPVKEIFE